MFFCKFITESSPNLEVTSLKDVVSSQVLSAVTDSNEDHKTYQLDDQPEISFVPQAVKTKGVKSVAKSSYSDLKSVKAHRAGGAEGHEQLTSVSLHSVNLTPANEFVSFNVHDSTVKSANVTLRKQSRETFLMGTEVGKASERSTPQVTVQPFMIEEAPVRDDGQSDWSLSSNGSAVPNKLHFSSYHHKKTNLLNMHSLSGHSVENLDFGSHSGNDSDVTVYKEIAKKPTDVKPKLNTHSNISKSREPIPGSDGVKNYRHCSKSLFSEFKMCLKDSGLDSPLPQIQK